ncbi:MAG: AsmA-like C-terminal region-containing protein [Bacteroidales bacterium]
MKKFLKWSAITLSGLLIVLLLLPVFLQDEVTSLILNAVNKNISTTIEAGKIRLSFIRRFPRASVILRDVTVFSSPDFDRNQFRHNCDTLLFARSAALEFKITDLVRGRYDVASVIVRDGSVSLYTDKGGSVNWNVSTGKGNGQDDFSLDIGKIVLYNITALYENRMSSLEIRGLIRNSKMKSAFKPGSIEFRSSSDVDITTLVIDSYRMNTNLSGSVDLDLNDSADGLVFNRGQINMDPILLTLSGRIDKDDYVDISVTGTHLDMSRIKKILPSKVTDAIRDFSIAGFADATCTVKGKSAKAENPVVVAEFSVNNGTIISRSSSIKAENIELRGNLVSGGGSEGELSLETFTTTIGSATWKGELHINNFKSPELTLFFSGEVIPRELLDFYKVKEVTRPEGSARLNLKLKGPLPSGKKMTAADFTDMNPEADISFSSLGFELVSSHMRFRDISGNVMLSSTLWADNMVFSVNDQRFRMDGEFANFPAWLAGKPVRIKANAEIWSENIEPEKFLSSADESGETGKRAIMLPAGMELNLKVRSDNFKYRNFDAGNISADLEYKPGILNIKKFTLNSMDGTLSGTCMLLQNADKSYISKGTFDISDVDIYKAFISFNNFSQSFIKAENLAGTVSGNFTMLLPLDSMLSPQTRSLTAEGKYVINNGSLKNFEPVMALSKYVELSELGNITFSRLENDLFIRNNYLAIPQMEIKSSAADITVSGKHDFDNQFEYHVRTYLSDVLSRKARGKKKPVTEFGAVEDDGLGRTSIFLKINGKDDDFKVSYDLKAATGKVRESLKNEKSNLKTILNEEYGTTKAGQTQSKDVAPKPKFRIEWSENDSVSTARDTVRKESTRGLNRLFRKKNN